jgi:hypothetical protein
MLIPCCAEPCMLCMYGLPPASSSFSCLQRTALLAAVRLRPGLQHVLPASSHCYCYCCCYCYWPIFSLCLCLCSPPSVIFSVVTIIVVIIIKGALRDSDPRPSGPSAKPLHICALRSVSQRVSEPHVITSYISVYCSLNSLSCITYISVNISEGMFITQ